MSVLFCDLVGFTAASEAADPEDVRARLRPYHARLRSDIEAYGGTVEKFVGDAVMAVFGAPVAHEDDAERAVRAALTILEAIAELNEADPVLALHVRIGINTGEAVVVLGAKPEEGEGIVTGDVVNTASRLQGVAPINGIACSEQTYRSTERVFEYEELEPVTVKGKSEALALFRPLRPRARFGSDLTRTYSTPLVGRELEKPLLLGTYERAAKQRSCQLVTIVGEPGVGKSRLCAELFQHIEQSPEVIWRQGRCLPYGEGIAFWALGEVVKAECGILESDSPTEAAAKLERALPADDPDRAWLKARLSPLVGAPAEPASQEESYTAWRRFLESLAERGPTVLCFEDLHWADAAFLSFLEHLADWSESVPLLLLCTARPELHEQRPSWAAGLRNATTINLAPLSEEDTARLLSLLLEQAVLPVEAQRALLDRTGGNPLYAEEYVRLLADRDVLAGKLEDVPFPDSVQALIAARLDTLSPERKSLLQDAAVIGKVFWAGALGEMGGRDAREVEQDLHELARKELVRPCPHELDGGGAGIRLLARAGQRRLLRPDSALLPCCSPSRRCCLDRAQGWGASGGPRRRARAPLPGSARARSRSREHRGDGGARGRRDPVPRPRRRTGARARRPERRGELGPGARAGSRRSPGASLPARALGKGCAATGPAGGSASGTRGSDRPLPGTGRERGRRAGVDRGLSQCSGRSEIRAGRRRSPRLWRCSRRSRPAPSS